MTPARWARTCQDLDIPILTDTPARRLLTEDGRVTGAETPAGPIAAARGVVLACGGYARDLTRRAGVYAHLRAGGEHHSPVPADNTGDGIRLAEAVGGAFAAEFAQPAACMPVSRVPGKGIFPHLLDRYKPAPMPLWPWLRSGYLRRGRTPADLARACGIDPGVLTATLEAYNAHAVRGEDPEFGRGTTSFNRYLADPAQCPNPCVAPLDEAPYYAVRLEMGDLGTFDGLKTTVQGQVPTPAGAPIAGLYAVGNDRASIMGGNYPGAGITLGPAMTFGWITGRHLAGVDDTRGAQA